MCYLDLRRIGIDEVADILVQKLDGADAAMSRQLPPQTWVAAFGVMTAVLLESGNLPAEVPSSCPLLCDWLTQDLLSRLAQAPLGETRVVEEDRSGETLSVRVAFDWDPSDGPLNFGDIAWWELLEVLPYDVVYESEGGD
jgi:hypothetical protein